MAGSISLAEELFSRGDSGFLNEFRACSDAGRLGAFAAKWFADPRPFARRTLLEYLDRPLTCFRHEAFVKRLYKLAEAANDDELMGAFLIAFDRSVRRVRIRKRLYKTGQFTDAVEAQRALDEWATKGYYSTTLTAHKGRIYTSAVRESDDAVEPGNTTLPRPRKFLDRSHKGNDWHPRPKSGQVLFTPQTRRYLRRRTWRYLRKLGPTDPERYATTVARLLVRYTDEDVDSDVHLLDHWGLVHILFHHSPALESSPRGWRFAAGKTIADLYPAPAFEAVWAARPELLFDVLVRANGRAVRQWALKLLSNRHAEWIGRQPPAVYFRLADHADPELSAYGFNLLERVPDLSDLPVTFWIERLEGDDLETITRYSRLMSQRVDPSRVSGMDAIRLATNRSRPIAELGLRYLKAKPFVPSLGPALGALARAECESLRPEILEWLKATLLSFGEPSDDWLIEWMDSPYAEVRAAGWHWVNETPAAPSPGLWAKLLESPYADVREGLVAHLRTRSKSNVDGMTGLWASVLCDVGQGGRSKPEVVRQIVRQIEASPNEAGAYVPLLAVCVRSGRRTEFRAGLAGVVGLGERIPELKPALGRQFPELVWQ